MNRNELIDKLFEKGKESNIEDLEAHVIKKSSINFTIFENELEKYQVAEEEVISLRGIYNGKMGYSYTENLEAEYLNELIDNLIQYAENNDNEEVEEIARPDKPIGTLENKNLLANTSEEEKIDYLFDLEKRAFEADERVKSISQCNYSETSKSIFIRNTKGLKLEDSHSMGVISIGAVVEEDGDIQTSHTHCLFNDLKEKYKDDLIRDSVLDGVISLGASPVESGNYKVVLRNNVAANMFSSFMPVFLGDVVQKNLSRFKGKLGDQVAVDILSIKEDPLMENGSFYRSFDDEGTPTFSKHLIENGKLKTFLHNNKTAKKEGIESTGNGFKDSHKSSIGVVGSNMYIEEGEESLAELIASMDKGIVITAIHGLHAGINPTSGDFSLSSIGLLVENGEVTRPLEEITVAGNFFEMLSDIETIGNDRAYSYPGDNYFGSPSLKIKELAISGK